MKRFSIIFIIMSLIITMTGCGSSKKAPEGSTGGKDGQVQDASEENGLKAGFIFSAQSNGPDTVSRMEGIRKMQYETGLTDEQLIIKNNVSAKQCADTITSMIDAGATIIFAMDSSYEDSVAEAAKNHEDVQFCQEDGTRAASSGLSNLHNYYAKTYESYYVGGVVAGMKLNAMLDKGTISSEDCVVGFVADEESPEAISNFTAFYLGIGDVCSQASMLVRYVGSSGDYDADAKEAQQLIKAGAVMIGQYTQTTGVATVCAENDVDLVGNDVNMISSAPKEALTSAGTDWSAYYIYAIDSMVSGVAIETDWAGGYAEGASTITQLNDKIVAAGTVKQVAKIEKSLKSGKEKVFNTDSFTIDGEKLETLVKSSKNYKSYKKYVSGGYYHECEKQSAPTFKFIVDGIKVSTHDYVADEEASEDTSEQ